jgi:hypothetical protein
VNLRLRAGVFRNSAKTWRLRKVNEKAILLSLAAISFLTTATLLAQVQETTDNTLAEASQLRNAGKLPEAEMRRRGALVNSPQGAGA